MKEQVIKKVQTFLEKRKIEFVNNSIAYAGLRRDAPQIDGSKKNIHIVTYQVQNIKTDPYAFSIYFVFIDVGNNKIIEILGPQYSEKIE